MTRIPVPAMSSEERKIRALQRIEQSRSALILALSPEVPNARSTDPGRRSPGDSSISLLSMLASRVERDGVVGGVGRTLRALARRWWKRQPWHGPVELVGRTVAHEAAPVIRRHPLAALALGAALGAAAVTATPRIWRPMREQAAPWRSNAGRMLWMQLNQVPVQMAIAGALAAFIADASQQTRSASRQRTGP